MEETRNYIFDVFEKYNLKAERYIDKKWLNLAYAKANPIIQKYFYDVLQQMIDEDFFECKDGHGDTWFLTQKGEDTLFAYIKERNRKMNENSSGININVSPVISPTFNQTNTQDSSNVITQTQELNLQFLLKDQLDKETYKKVEEIITSSTTTKEDKICKLKKIIGDLGSNLVSNLLANLIIGLPWL